MFQCVHHEHRSQPLSLKRESQNKTPERTHLDLSLSHVHVYKQEIKKKVKCCQKSIIQIFLIFHSYLFFIQIVYTQDIFLFIYLFISSHTKLRNFFLFILPHHPYLFFLTDVLYIHFYYSFKTSPYCKLLYLYFPLIINFIKLIQSFYYIYKIKRIFKK